jgi:hypothetical protein
VAVAVLYEFRGMTQDHYDRFIQDAYHGGPMPGVIAHAAGPSDEGWWAFDVYESQDAAEGIGPRAIERLRGMGVTEEPAVRTFEVHKALTG